LKYFSQKPRIYKNFVTLSDPYWKLTRHSTYMYIFGEGVSKTHHFVHTLKIGHSTSFLRIYKSHYSLGFVNSKPFPDLNPKVTDQPSFFLWPLSGAAQSKSKGTKSSLLNELIKFKNPFLLKFRYRKLFKVWISNSRGDQLPLGQNLLEKFLARQLFWIGDPFYSFQNFQRVGMILHVK